MTSARQIATRVTPLGDVSSPRFGVLRRKCACGGSAGTKGECEECKKKTMSLQRRATGAATPASVPPIVHDVLRSPGRPLDAATRAHMEPRFGHDFSNVRVHADARAAESARAVSARAYAVGNEIVFNSGEYQPHSSTGLASIAHELTHVVQQTDGRPAPVPDSIRLGAPGDAAEREAEDASRGPWRPITTAVRDGAQLRRQPQGEDEPKKEPPPVIPLPHPFDRLDIKPIFPQTPIQVPSLEDINKGIWNLEGHDKPGKPSGRCPLDWPMRAGLCCPKFVTDPDRCCPPYRMTNLGRCCPSDQYADGLDCKKFPESKPTPPPGPPGKDTPSTPPFTPSDAPAPGRNLPPRAPLTVSMDIYFKVNQPGSVVGEKPLRDSLTTSGSATLDGVIAWLKQGTQFAVQLTGKASIEGPPAHNHDLGGYRASSVANALTRAGLAGRIADPPLLPAACPALEDGIHNCGDTTASKTIDEHDRQVRATLFIPPGKP